MPGRRSKLPFRISPGIQSSLTKSLVRMLVVRCKIQVALNQQRPREGVVADSVAPHPRIYQRQRHQKQNQHDPRRKFRTNHDTAIPMVVLTLQQKATRYRGEIHFTATADACSIACVSKYRTSNWDCQSCRIQSSQLWVGKLAAVKTIVGPGCWKPRLDVPQLAFPADAKTHGR